MSRYCVRHAQAHFRTRDPMGRMARPAELAPYRELAQFHLDNGLADHPAISAAEKYLARLLTHDGFPPKFRGHIDRLRIGGASGRGMLLACLSVYGLSHYGHARAFTSDACFFANLGSRFFRTTSLGWVTTATGKRDQYRPPGLDCEAMGRALAGKIGALCLRFWKRVEANTDETEQREMSVIEALRAHPL